MQSVFLLRYLYRCYEVLAVGRALTIFQNDWVCTRISNFFQSPFFSIASLGPSRQCVWRQHETTQKKGQN